MAQSQETQVNLKINRVPSKSVLDNMVANNQLQPNQLYMIESEQGDGLVALQTKTVWTNSSPSSSFAAQSVSSSDTITDYDYFLVEYKLETSSINFYVQLMKGSCQLTYLNRAYSFWGNRGISIDVTNNKFSIGDAYYGSSASLNNGLFIPTKIIGIKLINSQAEVTNVYSTDETVVGRWIDGKPIYRKVFELTNEITISNSSWTSSTISISSNNIDKVIDAKTFNSNYTLGYCMAAINIDSYVDLLASRANAGLTANKIILEYTKTTD